jgi:hypothetical protein
MSFIVTGADGQPIEIPDKRWYRNTKARVERRAVLDKLSINARQIDCYLEPYTMGFDSELAVKMVGGGERVPVTPRDVMRATQKSPRDFRRGMDELKAAGLGDRKGTGDGPLHKGKVQLFSWAIPRDPQPKKGAARAPIPEWFEARFPKKSVVSRLVKRLKIDIDPELEEAARAPYLAGLEEDARALEEAEKRVIARLKAGSAEAKTAPIRKRTERTSERTGDAAAAASLAEAPPPPPLSPAPAPESIAPILKAFAPVGAIDDEFARGVLAECRQEDQSVTVQDVVSRIPELHINAGARSPVRVLRTEIAKLFRGEALATWQGEQLEREAAQQSRQSEAYTTPIDDTPIDEEQLKAEGIERMRRKIQAEDGKAKGAP